MDTFLLSIIAGMGAIMLAMTNRFYNFITNSMRDHEERIDSLEKHTNIERRHLQKGRN